MTHDLDWPDPFAFMVYDRGFAILEGLVGEEGVERLTLEEAGEQLHQLIEETELEQVPLLYAVLHYVIGQRADASVPIARGERHVIVYILEQRVDIEADVRALREAGCTRPADRLFRYERYLHLQCYQ